MDYRCAYPRAFKGWEIGVLFSDVPPLLQKVHTTTTVVWQTNVAHRSTLCSGAYGIGTDHIQYDVVAEDYDLLYTMMMLKHDAKFHDVDSLITLYADDTQRLKAAMKRHDGGKAYGATC